MRLVGIGVLVVVGCMRSDLLPVPPGDGPQPGDDVGSAGGDSEAGDGDDTPAPLAQQRVEASDAEAGDWFGVELDISGDRAIIGAWYEDEQDDDAGAAYLFVRGPDGWRQERKLIASDGAAGDRFGSSVAIAGDDVVVGADLRSMAYWYRFDASVWLERDRLGPGATNLFGVAVDVAGELLIVGASLDDEVASNAGAAQVYRFFGSGWLEEEKLVTVDGEVDDRLGRSVAIDGDWALVGAPEDDGSGAEAGAAYLFHHSAGTWTFDAELNPTDAASEHRFGYRVALEGDTAMVAAYQATEGVYPRSGAVYVFERQGTEWVEVQKVRPSDPAAELRFGTSVAFAGNFAVVGAEYDAERAGAVYLFEREGSTWTQRRKIVADDRAPDHRFGRAVAISASTVLIGAYRHGAAGPEAGAVYFIDLP